MAAEHRRAVHLVFERLEAHDLLDLARDVCARRGVVLDELCGDSRACSVSRARQELWWRIRHHPGRHYSYSEIARLFDRDPTTVLAGIAAHRRRVAHALTETSRAVAIAVEQDPEVS